MLVAILDEIGSPPHTDNFVHDDRGNVFSNDGSGDGHGNGEADGNNQASPGTNRRPDHENSPEASELDMSSAEAFINSVWEIYQIILEDSHGFLANYYGILPMNEIEMTLKVFSPAFIREMVSFYNDLGSDFIVRIEDYDKDFYGYTSWYFNGDLIITLHYDAKLSSRGFFQYTLAHELAHAAHYIVEEHIGELRSERELRRFNRSFPYVGSDYYYYWDEYIHSAMFAYDYGMYDHWEDWATVVEILVSQPYDDTFSRLADPQNESLLRKAQYIRHMMYRYISDECFLVFSSLYEAEEHLRMAS